MLTQEWDMGKALDTRFLEGEISGEKKGEKKGADRRDFEIVRQMLSVGLKPEEITKYTGIPADKIKLLH